MRAMGDEGRAADDKGNVTLFACPARAGAELEKKMHTHREGAALDLDTNTHTHEFGQPQEQLCVCVCAKHTTRECVASQGLALD